MGTGVISCQVRGIKYLCPHDSSMAFAITSYVVGTSTSAKSSRLTLIFTITTILAGSYCYFLQESNGS